jgi:hypothetical protein
MADPMSSSTYYWVGLGHSPDMSGTCPKVDIIYGQTDTSLWDVRLSSVRHPNVCMTAPNVCMTAPTYGAFAAVSRGFCSGGGVSHRSHWPLPIEIAWIIPLRRK